MNEFERIRAIERALGTRARGLGDDCAVLPPVDGSLVLSTDTSVQDVHFRLDWLTLREIGWRARESFETGLARTIDWYLANEAWWMPLRAKRYDGQRLGLIQRPKALEQQQQVG